LVNAPPFFGRKNCWEVKTGGVVEEKEREKAEERQRCKKVVETT